MSVNIKDIEKIYREFRHAQGDYFGRGYRMPKDFESYFNNKFNKSTRLALTKITGWFLTKWQNIDPYNYFLCGFELYKKGFTYVRSFNKKILLLYKTKDKNNKREIRITKENLIKSASFVKKYLIKNNINLYEYMNIRNCNQKVVVDHYLKNKIDASFFVFLLNKGMILNGNDRSMIPYINSNFRKIKFGLNDINNFVKKMEEKLI